MKRLLVLLLTLGIFAGVAYAHNGMEHLMGTVTAITPTNLTVKTMEGKTQTVVLTSDTKYTRESDSLKLEDIKVGDNVVVHAAKKGDQLTATEVKIGAMKGMHGDMGNMKGMKMDDSSKTTQR